MLLFLGLGTCHALVAQDTQLFRFVSLRDNQEPWPKVLHHNVPGQQVEGIAISNTDFTPTDGYLQAFILQPIPDGFGQTYIISAKDPRYFLKHDAGHSTVEFSPRAEGEDPTLYAWEVEFKNTTTFNEATTFAVAISNVGGERLSALYMDENGSVSLRPIEYTGDNLPTPFLFALQKTPNVF